MKVRLAIYLLALLVVALPGRTGTGTGLRDVPTAEPALRFDSADRGFPVLRVALGLVLISGLGIELALLRRSR